MLRKKSICITAVAMIIGMMISSALPMQVMAASSSAAISIGDITSPTELVDAVKEQIGDVFQNLDEETAKDLFSFAQEKAADGALDSEEGIEHAISEGEDKYGVTINEQDARKIVKVMTQLEDMGFDSEKIIDDTSKLYDQYGSDFVEHVDEVVKTAVADAAGNAAKSFFQSILEAVKDFFRNLF